MRIYDRHDPPFCSHRRVCAVDPWVRIYPPPSPGVRGQRAAVSGRLYRLQLRLLSARAKHLTTTAKLPHPWEFVHDEVGYNYRLPNLNAALGCAQMERLPEMLAIKADIAARYAARYAARFAELGVPFIQAPPGTTARFGD